MKKSLFISGSMSINTLPIFIQKTLEKIFQEKKYTLLIGDASGIDTLVQKYCNQRTFYDVEIFSIFQNPRNYISKNFTPHFIQTTEKNPRKKQQEKDIAMTKKSDALLVIWDGKSKGSYENILRGLEQNKHIEVFYNEKFLSQGEITKKNIDNIFSENYEYSASEIIKEKIFPKIKTVKSFEKKLLQYSILTLKNDEIIPNEKWKNQISISLSL